MRSHYQPLKMKYIDKHTINLSSFDPSRVKKVRCRKILLYLSFTQDFLLGRFCVSSQETASTKKRCFRTVQVKFVLDVRLVTMSLIYTRLLSRWHSRFFPLSFEFDYSFELSNNSVFINPLCTLNKFFVHFRDHQS